jgi:hypothetical protein
MKKSKLLKIAIPCMIVLVVFVLYEYVYLAVAADLDALRERQAVKMQTLNKSIALIAQKPEFEKQLAAIRELAKTQSAKLIEGEPISIASANLQGTVKGIVTGRSGTVSSERIAKPEELDKSATAEKASLPAKEPLTAKGRPSAVAKTAPKQPEGGRLKIITVSMDASLPDTGALSDVLYSLETRTPYLVLRELDIRVRNFKEPRELMVRMDVSGIYGGK